MCGWIDWPKLQLGIEDRFLPQLQHTSNKIYEEKGVTCALNYFLCRTWSINNMKYILHYMSLYRFKNTCSNYT